MEDPICMETGRMAHNGACPVHSGDACLHTGPWMVEQVRRAQAFMRGGTGTTPQEQEIETLRAEVEQQRHLLHAQRERAEKAEDRAVQQRDFFVQAMQSRDACLLEIERLKPGRADSFIREMRAGKPPQEQLAAMRESWGVHEADDDNRG